MSEYIFLEEIQMLVNCNFSNYYFLKLKKLSDIIVTKHLDNDVKASGYIKKELSNVNELDILDEYHAL
jgi:hypothetical protein